VASNNIKKDFEKAYKAGKLTVNKDEIFTPGSVGRGIAKVAAKVTGKNLTTAEKAIVASVKKIAKTGKPGDVQKALDKLSLAERRTYSQALKKAVPKSNKIVKPTKQATPLKSFNRKTEPINKNSETDFHLEQAYAKSLKATKAMGGDIKKVKVTYNGRTIDYNGIK